MRTPRDPILRGRALDLSLAAGAVFTLGIPLAVLVLESVGDRWYFPALMPPGLTGVAWRDLAGGDPAFLRALANSLLLATACAAISTALGLPAARALAAWRGRAASAVEMALVVLPVLPPVLLGAGTQVFYLQSGLSGTLAGVLCAHLMIALPYATVLFTGAVRTLDPRYDAVAATLGASPAHRAWRVRWLLLRPTTVTVVLFAFLISWGQYALTLTAGAGRVQTLPTLVFGYLRGGNALYAGVAGTLIALPALLGAPLLGRSLARVRPGVW